MQYDKALKGYRKVKNVEGFARIKDKMGDRNGAIRLLLKNNRIKDALIYAQRYESEGQEISKVHTVDYIANEYIKKLKKNKMRNQEEIEAIRQYIPQSQQVSLLKAAGMLKEACDLLIANGELNEVYRIYRAQGWYDEGIQLAITKKDRAIFVMLKATEEMSGESGMLEERTKKVLAKEIGHSNDTEAKATLIYGKAMQNHKTLGDMLLHFMRINNPVGCVEAFIMVMKNAQYDVTNQRWENIPKGESLPQLALKVCGYAKKAQSFLEERDNFELKRIETFYGFKKSFSSSSYSIPPSSYPWTNKLLENLPKDPDSEGMLQLSEREVTDTIKSHLDDFITMIITNDEFKIVSVFKKELMSSPLHQDIENGGYLAESFLRHPNRSLASEYFTSSLFACQIANYGSDQFDKSTVLRCISNLLSPQAASQLHIPTIFFPPNFNDVREVLYCEAIGILATDDKDFDFNQWLESWRLLFATKRNSKMETSLKLRGGHYHDKKSKVASSDGYTQVLHRQRSKGPPHQDILPVYVLDSEGQHQHIMYLWLQACDMIHGNKVLASCTVTVHKILCSLANRRAIWCTISLSNLMNIAIIHTSAILAMHAMASECSHQPCSIYIPSTYENTVQIFCTMNALSGKQNYNLFKSCLKDVTDRERKHLLHDFKRKLFNLLRTILRVMLGLVNEAFNPLKYAMEHESSVLNHEARHCLTLVMTLYGNMVLMNCPDPILRLCRQQIYDSMKHCVPAAHSLKQECDLFSKSTTITGCFVAVKNLVNASKDSLIQMNVKRNVRYGGHMIDFKETNMAIPQIRLPSITLEVTPPVSSKPSVVMKESLSVHQGATSHTVSNVEQDQASTMSTSVPETDMDPISMEVVDETIDDEIRDAMASIEERSSIPQNYPEKTDNTVDDNICKICGIPLIDDASSDTAPEERQDTHYHTEIHLTNKVLFERFKSEQKDFYEPLKKHLLELVNSKCKPLLDEISIPDTDLRKIMETVDEELKKNDDALNGIGMSAEWREGIRVQYESTERMESLRRKVMKEIEITEKKQSEIEKEKRQQELKEAEEIEEEEEWENKEEKIMNANIDSGQNNKIRQRKRKRNKRLNQL